VIAVISLSDSCALGKNSGPNRIGRSTDGLNRSLYPQSQGRTEPLVNAYQSDKNIKPDTPVGIVRQAGREGQTYTITTLKDMLNEEIDMVTTIVVGNSMTRVINGRMVTARGYDV
jgi:precorrin-3B C17-methyltransferase